MSNYTPTTEDIKYSYAQRKQDEAGFDRWYRMIREDAFAQGRDSGRYIDTERERERIIKLLEAEGSSTFSLAYIISLINGENK